MKRYGDNLPSSNNLEDELEDQSGRNVQVMYGGCGVRFGTFSKPVDHTPKRKKPSLFSLLGFKRNKMKKENS